ncbi:MAG: porin [Burkholderiaceae bacterium]
MKVTKPTHIASIVGLAFGCVATANAQSSPGISIDKSPSVTIGQTTIRFYGILDAGLTYVNNSGGSKVLKAVAGANLGSRLGIAVTQELGNGNRAIAVAESGFNNMNGKEGQGGLLFGRQIYVGLSADRWGTLTAGRQYDLIVDNVGPTTLNLNGWGAYFAHANDIDNTNDGYRVNNSFKYASPRIAGFMASAMYAPGGTNNFSAQSTTSFGLNYSNGGLLVSAAYLFAKNPGAQFADGNFVPNNTRDVGIFGYVGQPDDQEVSGVGVKYQLNDATTLGANLTHTNFGHANGTQSSVSFNSYEVWMGYKLTQEWMVYGGLTYVDGKVGYSGEKPSYKQLNLATSYALFKGTDLVFTVNYQRAGGGAHADIYQSILASQSTTTSQLALHAGLRFRF